MSWPKQGFWVTIAGGIVPPLLARLFVLLLLPRDAFPSLSWYFNSTDILLFGLVTTVVSFLELLQIAIPSANPKRAELEKLRFWVIIASVLMAFLFAGTLAGVYLHELGHGGVAKPNLAFAIIFAAVSAGIAYFTDTLKPT